MRDPEGFPGEDTRDHGNLEGEPQRESGRKWAWMRRAATGAAALGMVGLVRASAMGELATSGRSLKSIDNTDPQWGCGLLGALPGISEDGVAAPETQRLIESLKRSSSFGKVSFWNWNLAPQTTPDGATEHLTKDFTFMPEVWGANVVNAEWVREAGAVDFWDSNGKKSPAQMANIFMGMNEPDIQGSCMGDMFGTCTRPCTPDAVRANDCPAANRQIGLPPSPPNSRGMCDCWSMSEATGVGFWPVPGCSAEQPLPDLWNQEPQCIDKVMSNWKETARIAWQKGYKYLTTPLLAVDVSYAEKFIEKACGCVNGACSCTDASCGCPVYVGLHFYAFDCRPRETGAYHHFEERVNLIARLMEKYTFLKGAIINEVGMLNCAPTEEDPICVPDSGKFPAKLDKNFGCPANEELPEGLATFVTEILELSIGITTSDGRPVVKSFSWFNIDRGGGTYNLRLFDDDGTVNKLGEAYMRTCEKWGERL
ncbi:unnamed protein product [Effrenium voratum]|nr:unnamed protein product [Effrenium voratum]CAJ1452949.1 unnamed protein product [Effrenium voratum]